jgi:hypothetical protein
MFIGRATSQDFGVSIVGSVRETASARRVRLGPLAAATALNFLWQVPYAVHQYGVAWLRLSVWSLGLVLAGVWFAVAARRYRAGRPGGRGMLVIFLAVEAAFYLLHNLTGAFAADLPLSNPIVLIASALGYATALLAVAYLWLLRSLEDDPKRGYGGGRAAR